MAPSVERGPNRLLSAMSTEDYQLLAPNLVGVALPLRFVLETRSRPIPNVYFVEFGIVSLVARSKGGRRIEGGLIGREGVTGVPVLLGGDRSPNESYVQIAGSGQRLASDDLRAAMEVSSTLRWLMLRFAQVFLTQTTQTSLANGLAKIEERLARWLLMAQDRLSTAELP